MLITLVEYAEKNGISIVTARQRAQRGAYKTAVKEGRDWMIDDEEVHIDHRKKQDESPTESSVEPSKNTKKIKRPYAIVFPPRDGKFEIAIYNSYAIKDELKERGYNYEDVEVEMKDIPAVFRSPWDYNNWSIRLPEDEARKEIKTIIERGLVWKFGYYSDNPDPIMQVLNGGIVRWTNNILWKE